MIPISTYEHPSTHSRHIENWVRTIVPSAHPSDIATSGSTSTVSNPPPPPPPLTKPTFANDEAADKPDHPR